MLQNNTTSVKVSFHIVGDVFNLDWISEKLDVLPTETRKKGEQLSNKRMPNIETSWTLGTEYEESLDVDIQMDKVLENFYDKTDKLKEICEHLDVEIVVLIVIKMYDNQTPALCFGKKVLAFLNEVNAEVGVDMYICD